VEKLCIYSIKPVFRDTKKVKLQKNRLGINSDGDHMLISSHFPIQNEEKISPKRSSEEKPPVISDRWRWA